MTVCLVQSSPVQHTADPAVPDGGMALGLGPCPCSINSTTSSEALSYCHLTFKSLALLPRASLMHRRCRGSHAIDA